MAYETVLYDKADHIATITLNRPDRLNAYNHQLAIDLLDAMRAAEADVDVRCIILTGAGRAFCAGDDIRDWNKNIEQREQVVERPNPLVTPLIHREEIGTFIMNMTTPVIAALNGPAVGIGATIPLTCDLCTASENARIAFLFAKRGLTPEAGSAFLLPRTVGLRMARELCFTGRFVSAQEAKEIGLVNAVYPADQFMASTIEYAKQVAAIPPMSVKFMKRGINLALDSSLRDTLEYEHWALRTCFQTEDHKEAVRAFLEKRDPVFKGR